MKNIKLFLATVLAVTVFFACTQPDVLVTGSASAEKVSEKGLSAIDSMINQAVEKGWIAGATALVARNGKIVYDKAFGYSNAETGSPLKSDDLFRIASQTKAITSIAAMILFDEGKFQLEDPVSKFIPEFSSQGVIDVFNAADTTYTVKPVSREVTVKDLLTHTSGIDYAGIGSPMMNAIYAKAGIPVGFESGPKVLGPEMKKLVTLPLVHNPGERWTYGLNTDLLGYLVEIWSGMPLDRFFSERIFTPLEMKDTYFYLPAEKVSRLVEVHAADTSGKLKVVKNPFTVYPVEGKTYFSGGAGLTSTTRDYAAFLQMILNNGHYNGVQVLKPETVKLILSNHIGDLMLGNDKFGLGFQITTEKGKADSGMSVGSYSWGGYYSTSYWGDPEKKIVATLFIQQFPMEHGELHTNFRKLVYGALEE